MHFEDLGWNVWASKSFGDMSELVSVRLSHVVLWDHIFKSFLGAVVMRVIAGNARRQAHGGLKWILGCVILVGALTPRTRKSAISCCSIERVKGARASPVWVDAVVEDNLFWDLAATTAPSSGFDPDTSGWKAISRPVSALSSSSIAEQCFTASSLRSPPTPGEQTLSTPAIARRNLAIRGDLGGGLSYDLSLGPRELTLGTC